MDIVSRNNEHFVLNQGQRISPGLPSKPAAEAFAMYVEEHGLPTDKSKKNLMEWFLNLRKQKMEANRTSSQSNTYDTQPTEPTSPVDRVVKAVSRFNDQTITNTVI